MHAEALDINIDEVLNAKPLTMQSGVTLLMWACFWVGVVTFFVGFFGYPAGLLWGAFYVNLTFFMGLAVGGVVISVIFQIVRAKWSPPVRRIAEANIAFLPWAFLLFLCTYFGREHLFVWGREPMPGKEWWMQPDFVYTRHAICLGALFYLLWRFVRLSLRSDIGFALENNGKSARWRGWLHDSIAKDWQGSAMETIGNQATMSRMGPVLILLYAVIYSLFVFECVMNMNEIWYSNLFGAFNFIGNIYMGWCVTALWSIYWSKHSHDYNKVIQTSTLWDLGKMTFAFCMLWGYLFFSQFLPQWYGNLPEETQWMILRTREYPWKGLGWVTFSLCFILPFILLLSRDLKKTPQYYATVCFIILLGMWSEKYMVIMPEMSALQIPFNFVEVGLFFGFLGLYVLSVSKFLSQFPFVAVSAPVTRGSVEW